MNIAISLAQFIMLALGVMASRILVNSGAVPASSKALSDQIAIFAANQGVWLLAIPAAWLLFAGACAKWKPSLVKSSQSLGVGIAVAVLALIVAIFVL